MGHSEGKSMVYLEARCLMAIKGAGSQGVQNGSKIRMKGLGVPKLNSHGRGDLFVHVEVRTPEKLSREQRKALADLEADLPHVADVEVAALVKGLVELKRRHLAELEAKTARPHVFTKAPV